MTDTNPIEILYKRADGVDIFMDVYIPSTASKASPASILLWWHGGGLLQGSRKAVAPHMLQAPEKHNLCIVSVDYRLAPQTRMPGILEDCLDAIDFIHGVRFAEQTGHRANPSKIVVSGSSAGGWLSLLAGTGIGYKACGLPAPRPVQGIVAIYPITDLLDPFWKTKQRPVSYMDRVIDFSEVESFVDPTSAKTSWSAPDGKRSIFYHYMVQEAILSSLLLDGTNIKEEHFSIAAGIKLKKDTVIPPIYIVTGNSDGKVPHVQSLDVVAALKEIGEEVEYEELDGLDHGFDREAEYTMDKLYQFVAKVTK
ncbi:Non-reducing polyketide synthase pkbA [Psilocybe cubensis]|uniref:Non-reducing polyketide synthase pkbA n=2 Tax=Psilocybe cubensis TaxID=181762 RepID=A0ACB8GRL9_PSICU|nr:Non-reducing polyketide synthase pkbA [Psilocybe cubensis]KAH9478072.1 Non-reducing polyketide synthase pkbA [Psilocybe cubensis]